MPGPSFLRPLRPLKDREKVEAVMDAIAHYDIRKSESWTSIKSLMSHTAVEEIQAVPEGIFETEKEGFSAEATVYTRLGEGPADHNVTTLETLPAQVEGHFETQTTGPTKAVVDRMAIDTSALYR